MNKRVAVLVVVAGLAACTLSVVVPLRVAAARTHYPGAVAVAGAGIDLAGGQRGVIGWQTKFVTPDELGAVRAWYAARLGIAAASDVSFSPVDGCAWLTQAKLIIVVTHSVAVLACADPGGTRITVNEGARVGP